MKNVLIVENSNNPLSLDESVSTQSEKKYMLGGEFTKFGVKNRNERIYTADKFLPCLEELKDRMTTLGAVYGEYDHPDVFDLSMSKASHVIKSVEYMKESNSVHGTIQLLSTHWGKEARAIVSDGLPLFVSSRAAGVTEANGEVALKKLFTYDIVADPGFATARMSSINESVGFKNNTNFRIYEMADDSKINDLFNMNKNDMVTKKMISDYSQYLVTEIASIKQEVTSSLKNGNLDSSKLEKLLEYYENLNKTQTKVSEYLDYLAETIQVVVNENKDLKENQTKIINHNDYLAEQLEKAIGYSDYLAEELDKGIDATENISEKLEKSVEYNSYLAEELDKAIVYAEYVAENVDKSLEYTEYLAEQLDKNIEYSEYLAEHLDNSISYGEYLAESIETNIAYAEYIAENLDDNMSYVDYVAENVDNSIKYSKLIAEKLNGNKLFESMDDEERIPMPEEVGFEAHDEEEEEDQNLSIENDEETEEEEASINDTPELDATIEDEMEEDENQEIGEEECEPCGEEEEEEHEHSTEININIDESNTDLSKQMDMLIEEAKKRKASETNEHHFLKFLNKSQVDSFYSLNTAEQETVVCYINEKKATGKNYMSTADVLKMIKEALSTRTETLEEKLLRLMPEQIKPIWSELNESSKISILSQAKLHPDLNSDELVEHFWLTRSLKKNESVNRKLLSNDTLINDDKLSDDKVSLIMEKFRKL